MRLFGGARCAQLVALMVAVLLAGDAVLGAKVCSTYIEIASTCSGSPCPSSKISFGCFTVSGGQQTYLYSPCGSDPSTGCSGTYNECRLSRDPSFGPVNTEGFIDIQPGDSFACVAQANGASASSTTCQLTYDNLLDVARCTPTVNTGAQQVSFLFDFQITDIDAGGQCVQDDTCLSGACTNGYCCSSKGASSGCTACSSSNGDCTSCSSGYYLSGGQCYGLRSGGDFCSSNSQCASGSCKGQSCCSSKGASSGCTACSSSNGDCASCSSGYYLSGGQCYGRTSAGGFCSLGSQCASGVCKGGYCCSSKGSSSACSSCSSSSGDCASCSSSYYLSSGSCYSKRSSGDPCSYSGQCASGVCKGNSCCNSGGWHYACISCNSAGDCSSCRYGAAVSGGTCVFAASGGTSATTRTRGYSTYSRSSVTAAASCSQDYQCGSNLCRSNYCCAYGTSSACTSCDYLGQCVSCQTGYALSDGRCVRSTSSTPDGGDYCTYDFQCSSGRCLSSRCCNSGVSSGCTSCLSNGGCGGCSSGYVFTSENRCVLDNTGYYCSYDSDCASNLCRNNYCCQLYTISECTECSSGTGYCTDAAQPERGGSSSDSTAFVVPLAASLGSVFFILLVFVIVAAVVRKRYSSSVAVEHKAGPLTGEPLGRANDYDICKPAAPPVAVSHPDPFWIPHDDSSDDDSSDEE